MISELRLEAYRLQDLVVHFNEDWLSTASDERGSETYDVTPDFDLFEREDDGGLLVQLSIECRGVNADGPPRFNEVSVVVWGRFAFEDGVSEESRATLGQYNTVAMLHGIARGALIQATGGTVGGPFILPSLNYKAVIDRKLSEQSISSNSNRPDSCKQTDNMESEE